MRCLCLATLFAALSTGVSGAIACDAPQQMQGFKTCADIGKAEEEGALVVYSTDPEAAAEQELAKFHALFPKSNPRICACRLALSMRSCSPSARVAPILPTSPSFRT